MESSRQNLDRLRSQASNYAIDADTWSNQSRSHRIEGEEPANLGNRRLSVPFVITSPESSTKHLRARGTLRIFTSLGIHLTGTALLAAFVSILFSSPGGQFASRNAMNVDCDANGKIQVYDMYGYRFDIESDTYDRYGRSSWWDPSLVLSITIGFGRLSFPAAKGIDVCWDFFVGRVGQILLALASYPILRRSLACAMERRAVQVSTYSSIAFTGVSLSSLWATVVEVTRGLRYGLRAFPFVMLAQTLAIAYILGFATIVSVMTGYSTLYSAWVPRPDNQNRVAFSNLSLPAFIIVDGSRVGLWDHYMVFGSPSDHPDLLTYSRYSTYPSYDDFYDIACDMDTALRFFSCNTSIDDLDYYGRGYSYLNKTVFHNETTITDVANCSLEVKCGPPKTKHLMPQLNSYATVPIPLETHIAESWFQFGDGPSIHLDEPPLTIVVQKNGYISGFESDLMTYWLGYENMTFNASYIQATGECQPEEFYRWGFSSLLLFVFCVLSLIFLSDSTLSLPLRRS